MRALVFLVKMNKTKMKNYWKIFFFINETNKLKVLENIISLCTGRLEKYGNYTFAQNIQVISPTKKRRTWNQRIK